MTALTIPVVANDRPGRDSLPDGLNGYERTTVGLWARGHARLARQRESAWPARAAAHALLSRLRGLSDRVDLFHHYHADAVGDFEFIHSLLPTTKPLDDVLWHVRDAAFYRRWRAMAVDNG